jgi:hypothetical protein
MPLQVDVRRILLANAMKPLAGNKPLVQALQKHGQQVFGEPIPAVGTPLYTDVRLYVERGIPGVIYGAGPRTVLESMPNAPTSAAIWKTCAAPPRWWRARCWICSADRSPSATGRPARACFVQIIRQYTG